MNIFGLDIKIKGSNVVAEVPTESTDQIAETKSNFPLDLGMMGAGSYGGMIPPIVNRQFSGEKTPGELGVVIREIPLYQLLRLRAYSAFLTTDIVKTLASKRFQWVIGSGLDIEIEPNKDFLELEGIVIPDKFSDRVEARWNTYIKSVYADYERKRGLHRVAKDVYQDKWIGGDCLCVCRIEDEGVSVQFISGEHVKNPGIEWDGELAEGNYIRHGIEFNARGQEVAYYVENIGEKDGVHEYTRVPAFGEKTKRQMAWMVYGQKLSPDHKRGIPEITQVLEKVVKLDRYTEAGVSKAEKAANIVYTIEHDKDSTGEDPTVQLMQKKLNLTVKKEGEAVALPTDWEMATGLGTRIQQETSGTTINMVPGSKLAKFDTDIETKYGEFMTPNFDMVCASVDTPPEIALQKYNSNYSASRAAINGWGYVVSIDRDDFSEQFYKRFYKLWLEVEILSGRISAPGYIVALENNDFMVIEAYSNCRFLGKNMPHIDPLKEANAIRVLLGDKTKGEAPLISFEQAVELLGVGDWWVNFEKYLKENDELKKNNIDATENTNTKPDQELD